MAFFKEWTLCVCITLVLAAVFSLFTPQGTMKQLYRVLIALFIFVSFLLPLRDFRPSDMPSPSIAENAEEENRLVMYEDAVRRQVQTVLRENGIVGADVRCRLSLQEKTEIRVDSLEVAVPEEYEVVAVQTLLAEQLGVEARVMHIGE